MVQKMSSESPKGALFNQFAAVAKAAAHPHRLELLEQLAQGERSVERLADRVRISVANASQHLQQMRRGGLVVPRREGKFVFYRLADDAVLDLMTSLRRVAEATGARVVELPTMVGGAEGADDWIGLMDLLHDRLAAGLGVSAEAR